MSATTTNCAPRYLTGTKFGDGRGNVVFAAEYYKREAAFDKNRSFYTDSYKDPTVGGNFIGFIFGENGWNQLFNPGQSATRSNRHSVGRAHIQLSADSTAAIARSMAALQCRTVRSGIRTASTGHGLGRPADRQLPLFARQHLRQYEVHDTVNLRPARTARRSHPGAEVQRDRGLHVQSADALCVHGIGQVRHHGQAPFRVQCPLFTEHYARPSWRAPTPAMAGKRRCRTTPRRTARSIRR